MKVISTKTINTVSKTYEVVKRPQPANQDSGLVSLNGDELNSLTANDFLRIRVLNTDYSLKALVTVDAPTLKQKCRYVYYGHYYLYKFQ